MCRIRSLISWFSRKKSGKVRDVPFSKGSASEDGEISTNFLPNEFSKGDGISLLAGRGDYPLLCADRMLKLGVPVSLIASEDVSNELFDRFPKHRRVRFNAGQVGKILRQLRANGHPWAMMVGQIAPKRLFHGLKFDMTAIRMLAQLTRRNAETIFGALSKAVEACGVKILDARAFMDEHLATEGFMTKTRQLLSGVAHGIEVAKAIAGLNVGQGVVVHRGTVLAVEGFDGTDKMLQRCDEFKTGSKWFIKASKPHQDFRFDVPVIGVRTLLSMQKGGIRGVAVEMDRTLLFNKKNLIGEADRLGIAIYGYASL
jgi:DUF1009 family protein